MIEIIALVMTAFWILSVIVALFWPTRFRVVNALVATAIYMFVYLYPILIAPVVDRLLQALP